MDERGLVLPDIADIGVGAENANHLRKRWNTNVLVRQELDDLGFKVLPRPIVDQPQHLSKEDLMRSPNEDFNEMYARYLAWQNYAASILAKYDAELLQVRNTMKAIEVRYKEEVRKRETGLPPSKQSTVTEIIDKLWLNPDYEELAIEKQKLEQKHEEIKSHHKNFEETLKVISRQVEIKKLALEGDRIDRNIPFRTPRVSGRP